MINIDMSDSAWLDEATLAQRLQLDGKLRVKMVIRDLYAAQTPLETADNWLKAWYISEALAKHAQKFKCKFSEIGDGVGKVILDFANIDATNMAKQLVNFGVSEQAKPASNEHQ
jgi:hypothetical protein